MGGTQIYSSSHQGAPPDKETKTMIPKEGNDLLELHLDQGRKAESDVLAERMLAGAEAILGYALACNHLSPVEYGGRIASVKLIRAQRESKAIDVDRARQQVKWPAPKDDCAYRFDPMSGTFQN